MGTLKLFDGNDWQKIVGSGGDKPWTVVDDTTLTEAVSSYSVDLPAGTKEVRISIYPRVAVNGFKSLTVNGANVYCDNTNTAVNGGLITTFWYDANKDCPCWSMTHPYYNDPRGNGPAISGYWLAEELIPSNLTSERWNVDIKANGFTNIGTKDTKLLVENCRIIVEAR